MNNRRSFIIAVAWMLAPVIVYGQGLPMSPDFLPLEVGNLWTYEIADESGRVTGRMEMEILDHRIVEGLSLYVFTRLPFAPGGNFDDPIGVHFDRQDRQYVYTDGEVQGALFPARGERAEVVETDQTGLPLVVELDYGDRAVTLERGVGITGGRLSLAGGTGTVRLVGARVGADVVGAPDRGPGLPSLEVAEPTSNVVMPSETAPVLELEAEAAGSSHRLVLTVRNPTEKLMPFDFTTSQSFDFVVTEAGTGREIWRWARRMFFSEVTRSEAVRANGEWRFEAVWNHVDDELNSVPPGTYLVQGILVSETPFESAALQVRID